MQAIVVAQYGDPSVLELKRDLPLPSPTAGQVLVEVKAVGVNPVDTYIRAGAVPRVKPPYTPGFDGAGVVVDAPSSTRFKKGDRVYLAGALTGTYASHTLALESQVHPLPDVITFSQGAGVYVSYWTAYRALVQKAKARPGQTVLVHGASGGVGIAAVQIAAALGLRVIGTASTHEGRELVKQEGAHEVFNHQESDYIERVKQVTKDGAGVDIVIEMLADVNLVNDLDVIRGGGTIVIVGSRGAIDKFLPKLLMAKDATVIGFSLLTSSPEDSAEQQAFVRAGLANGSLRPIVAKELSLADAPKAHEEIIQGSHTGKIVLLP